MKKTVLLKNTRIRRIYFWIVRKIRKFKRRFMSRETTEQRRAYLLDICHGKIQYKNRKEAWNGAIKYKKIYGTEAGVYKCWMCHKFHLSKKQKMNIPNKYNKNV